VPNGYLAMVGQPFNPAIYPNLSFVYPSNVLPDLRGEFIRGWDNFRGADLGRALLSWQEDMFESHSHVANVSTSENIFDGGGVRAPAVGTSPTTSTGGNETRPRNVAFQYICRAK